MKKRDLKDYEMYLLRSRLSDNTIKAYIRAVQCFYHISGKHSPNAENVNRYTEWMFSRYKPSTINLYSVAFNRYLRYIGKQGLCIPTKRLRVRRSLENVLTVKEYQALLQCAKETGRSKYYMIMRVFAGTGIRVGELKYITVENARRGNALIDNKGRVREIFIADSLQKELLDFCGQTGIREGAIFLGNTGSPITRGAVWQMFVKIADISGVAKEKVHPHSFRHMMAVQYMSKYKNITELADILGHSSLEITRIYTMTSKEEKRKRLDRLYR